MPKVNDPRCSEQRMKGAAPGETALGRGPTPSDGYSRHEYDHPAAGWGAAKSVGLALRRAGEPLEGFRALFLMNQENGGFDLVCLTPFSHKSSLRPLGRRARRTRGNLGDGPGQSRPGLLRPAHRQRPGRLE
jgi:hypothetical protein